MNKNNEVMEFRKSILNECKAAIKERESRGVEGLVSIVVVCVAIVINKVILLHQEARFFLPISCELSQVWRCIKYAIFFFRYKSFNGFMLFFYSPFLTILLLRSLWALGAGTSLVILMKKKKEGRVPLFEL